MPYVVQNIGAEPEVIKRRDGSELVIQPNEVVEVDGATAKTIRSDKVIRIMPDSPDYPRRTE